jgi:hypothetical protein
MMTLSSESSAVLQIASFYCVTPVFQGDSLDERKCSSPWCGDVVSTFVVFSSHQTVSKLWVKLELSG